MIRTKTDYYEFKSTKKSSLKFKLPSFRASLSIEETFSFVQYTLYVKNSFDET